MVVTDAVFQALRSPLKALAGPITLNMLVISVTLAVSQLFRLLLKDTALKNIPFTDATAAVFQWFRSPLKEVASSNMLFRLVTLLKSGASVALRVPRLLQP
jgi:hypothetical protein